MTGVELRQHVLTYFRSRARRFQLDARHLEAERVLNWGGFASYSYRVGDGERSVHAKFATDQADMQRWLTVHERLETDYRAPKVLAWVDLPGTHYGGLVFEHIDGQTWDTSSYPALLHDLRDLLVRLHEDYELADQLGDGSRSYRHCWELRYREQFEEDLKTVRVNRPASVTDARLSWMEQEAQEVLALAAGTNAFEGMTRSPCHWDLWSNNVLVDASGRAWVLDWDSLAAGDTAEDLATLVWPFVHSHGKEWRDIIDGEADGPFEARMDLHLRAITLDYLIDVLADWAECNEPEWLETVRLHKEAQHQQFLEWYLSRWK
jgi:thiamine kinase-like enzyme